VKDLRRCTALGTRTFKIFAVFDFFDLAAASRSSIDRIGLDLRRCTALGTRTFKIFAVFDFFDLAAASRSSTPPSSQ
jgi:hypothetical protein